MEHQAIFFSKDKDKKTKSVICCNFGSLKGYCTVSLLFPEIFLINRHF